MSRPPLLTRRGLLPVFALGSSPWPRRNCFAESWPPIRLFDRPHSATRTLFRFPQFAQASVRHACVFGSLRPERRLPIAAREVIDDATDDFDTCDADPHCTAADCRS